LDNYEPNLPCRNARALLEKPYWYCSPQSPIFTLLLTKALQSPFASGPAGAHLTVLSLPYISSRWKKLIASARQQKDIDYLRAKIHPTVLAGYKAQKKILLSSFATNQTAVDENVFTLASLQKPLFRGYVEILSSNPWENPAVNWRTLSNPFDIQVLLEGTRFVRKLWKRPELAVLNPAETTPGIKLQSDEDLIAWIRTKTTPTF